MTGQKRYIASPDSNLSSSVKIGVPVMPSLMQIQNHENAEKLLEGLQVLAAGGEAGAVQPD